MKPPYSVPSMEEVRAVPWNGLNVVSTFAGCGGSSLGYRMAGFRVLWANEFVEAAREVYRVNAQPGAIIDGRDIRSVDPADVLRAIGMKVGELDVLDGSPPCASFSTAGKRAKHWGEVRKYSDTKQRTDDLFHEYARLLKGLRPRVFVAENVSGLVKGVAKGYFIEILAALKACGYDVRARLLDAQWLGVPQQRQRIIFVGVRDDLGVEPAFPAPLPHRYSVRDACPWIGSVVLTQQQGSPGIGKKQVDAAHPLPTVCGTQTNQFIIEPESDISRYAIGEEWDKLRPGQQSERYMSLVKADPEAPSPTVTSAGSTASLASVVHPTEKRKFTIAELKRICAFPDDFALSGSYAQQWERLGRAVPPLMMRAIATTLRDEVFAHVRDARHVQHAVA